ncbi:hypothetical protein Pmani_018634 [Petrolisthes manimaculis]|uniref:Lysosomal trafficking regulator n=1 Tax=Petrolisthes manimaculis TaxID=1843537 RepID=A0AAE1PKM6_9EUCA|nr:hypothetical protein Pmani_018634 [Petrolisthes manimaculis]
MLRTHGSLAYVTLVTGLAVTALGTVMVNAPHSGTNTFSCYGTSSVCCCARSGGSVGRDVVGTVVGVWAEVAQWRLTPSDLSQFLALFKADAPPVETLLAALNRVLEVSSREPQSALSFPCPATTTTTTTTTSPSSLHHHHHHHLTDTHTPHVPVHAPPTTPAAEAITRLHNAHMRHGLESCIAVSCVVCPVPRSLDWSPYNSGLACTTWLCIQDNGKSGSRSRHQMSPQSSFGHSSQSDAFCEGAARGSFCGGASSLGRDVGPTRLHLLSVGTQHLMFSLWLTTDKDYFEVCVSREMERESVVVSRGGGSRMGVCDGQWHHLALSIPTINVRRGGNLKISLVVDAVTFHAVTVAVPAVGSIKKSSPAYLLLGHTHTSLEGADGEEGLEWPGMGPRAAWSRQSPSLLMGNTFLFREPCLSRELCLYLGALGPDTTSLLPLTGRDERVLLSRLITTKLLTAGLDLSVLYGPAGVLVRPAQEALLILHIAQHPHHYLCYKPHIPSLQDTGNHYPSSSWQAGVLLGSVSPLRSQGPDLALLKLGGIMHIIYLFARLVEVGCREEVQGAGVQLLMGCIQASPQLAAQYEGLRGSSLLFRALSSPLATPGIQVMKALVDACTSTSVIQYQASRDVYTLASHVPAALTHRHHLLAIITSWKTFHPDSSANLTTKYCVDEHGERLTVLGMLLSVIRVLLSNTQPYRDFNLAQLRDIDALDKILFMCKELELTTGGVDGVCAPQLLVAVVTGLVGAPASTPANTLSSGLSLMLSAQDSLSSGFCSVPSSAPMPMLPFGLPWCGLGPGMVRVRDIAAVWGFLLLAHPAHLTYAATSQSTAYYLPRFPTPAAPHRSGQLVSVGVDLAAEMIDQPEQQHTLQHFQTGEWQIIENRDPFMQLQQIRQQQKAEIRKLRREGSIARGAYDSSDEDDDSEEWNVKSEDQVDRQFLQHKDSIDLSHTVPMTNTLEHKTEDGSLTDVPPKKQYCQEQNTGQERKRKISEGRSKAQVKALPKDETWVVVGVEGEEEEDDNDDDDGDDDDVEVSCLIQLVIGLVGVVEGVLRAASDTTARTVLAEALTTEQTVVMANHPHPLVRSAVLKLFGVVLERCSPEDGVVLLRQNVPLILAQQLHKHPLLSTHLVTAAFSLALGRPFTFDDYAVDCDPSLSLPHKVVLFVPVLALLPHTPQDVALSHNSLMVILDLLHKNMELIVPLIQKAHIVDALVCTLRAALHTEGIGVNDVTGESESGVLVADVTEILSWVINCLVASPQHKNFMLSLEVLHQVNLVRRGESAVCGGQACCVGHLQSTEAALLQVALSRTQATASTHQHTLAQDTHSTFKSKKTSMSVSTSLHNLKLFSPLAGREDSDSGLGSVLANYTTIPFTKSLHNISDQLFHGGFSSSSSSSQQTSDTEKREDKVLAHSELLYRFKVLVQKATDFLFMSAWSSVESMASVVSCPGAAETFSLFLLELLLSAVSAITQRKGNNGERCGWERMVWGCQDILRMHLSHLLVLATSPRTHFTTRTRAVHTISSHPRSQAILSYVVKSNHQLLYKVGIFVHELRYQNKGKLECGDVRSCEGLLQLLEEAGVHVLPPPELYPPQGAMREWSLVAEEKRLWQDESAKIAVLVVERCTKQDKRLLSKNVSMYEAVAQECSRLTRLVVDRQHVERKAVLSGIKRSQCRRVRLTHRWRELALVLTHERATWHSQRSYPRLVDCVHLLMSSFVFDSIILAFRVQSWELDQTEGPMRVRRRLTRGRLNISPRYLMPGYTHKIDVEQCGDPLESVLEEDSEMESAMAVMIERLNASERIVHMSRACVVSPGREQRGEVLVSLTAMYFVGEQLTVDMNQSGSTNEVVSVTWPFDTVREVHLRRYQLQDCALELFLTGGHSVLLAFSDTHHRNQVIGVLSMSEMPNISSKASLPEVTQQWREGHMTNFEYLTQLNKLAGRSFNDLMQYPVFPFILSNYTSDILSLHDPTNFRNLKKPIAVQHPHKEQHYINNYEITAQLSQDASDGPYHYGSHYSNSGIVLHFLVRLPPFTQLFLRYQDGNFDIPDRTFHALQTTWRLASCDSTTDFKELIPEFFFLPEIFLNSEGFNMGVRQSGERVHHVQLPPWSCDDPRRFVLVHRAALESPLVTQNLHHWIDLVFGYKQNGRAAVDAINVFHPATYFGYDVESGADEISREARKAMIKTYGQTPQQLFTNPHPPVTAPPRPQSPQAPEVLHEVRGLHWGTYAGSPADDRPTLALIQNLKTPTNTMTSLSHTELLLMGPHTHLLTLRPDKGGSSAYVVSSDHRDNIIRCRRLKDSLPQPLISVPPYDEVRWCSCGVGQVWVGLASGQILVYLVSTSTVGDDLVTTLPPSPLLAHTAPVTHMHISHAFSICVSGGEDGLCVIWDTNRLRYVRSVGCGGVGVQLVGVSETLGDWASVTPLGQRASVLRLYTVNAALVDSVVTPAPVTAMAFTAAPEGTAVNVIATSLADGVIRLWSIWDLRPVRELKTDRAKQPMISLHYTPDNNHLCGITETGVLVVWETTLVKTKLPKFITVPHV